MKIALAIGCQEHLDVAAIARLTPHAPGPGFNNCDNPPLSNPKLDPDATIPRCWFVSIVSNRAIRSRTVAALQICATSLYRARVGCGPTWWSLSCCWATAEGVGAIQRWPADLRPVLRRRGQTCPG